MLDNDDPDDSVIDRGMLRILFKVGAVWDLFKEIQEGQLNRLSSFKTRNPDPDMDIDYMKFKEVAEMVQIEKDITRLLVSESTRLIERVSSTPTRFG